MASTGRRRRFERRHGAVPYAELHCHSNFSFLDGASPPEDAAKVGLTALAITDHDGFYGIVRFAEAAEIGGAVAALGLTGGPAGANCCRASGT